MGRRRHHRRRSIRRADRSSAGTRQRRWLPSDREVRAAAVGVLVGCVSVPVRASLAVAVFLASLIPVAAQVARKRPNTPAARRLVLYVPPSAQVSFAAVVVGSNVHRVPFWLALPFALWICALTAAVRQPGPSSSARDVMAVVAVGSGASLAALGTWATSILPFLGLSATTFGVSFAIGGLALWARRDDVFHLTTVVSGLAMAMFGAAIMADDLAPGVAYVIVGCTYAGAGVAAHRGASSRPVAMGLGATFTLCGLICLAQDPFTGISLSAMGIAFIGAGVALQLHSDVILGIAAVTASLPLALLAAILGSRGGAGFAVAPVVAGAILLIGGGMILAHRRHRGPTPFAYSG